MMLAPRLAHARALVAMAMLVLCVPARAAPSGELVSAGSIAQAATAFRAICMAHPGDPAGQRAAALAARPRAFKAEPGSPPGVESLSAWPLQLSLLDTDRGRVCAVLSPMIDAPAPAAALAEVCRRLALGQGAPEGDEHVWRRGGAQTIGFSVAPRPDSDGRTWPTVQLTFTAAKAR